MRQSAKVALGVILCALSLVCLLLTILPISEMGLPALAGAVLIPIILEIGVKWGWMSYACVALLSLLITPSMEAKVLFIAFFGYYPVLKALIERLRKHRMDLAQCSLFLLELTTALIRLEWIIKLAVFNLTMIGAYWIMLTFLGLPADSFEIFGLDLPFVILAIGNVAFVLYDIALTGVITTYLRVLQPKLARLFRHG